MCCDSAENQDLLNLESFEELFLFVKFVGRHFHIVLSADPGWLRSRVVSQKPSPADQWQIHLAIAVIMKYKIQTSVQSLFPF